MELNELSLKTKPRRELRGSSTKRARLPAGAGVRGQRAEAAHR